MKKRKFHSINTKKTIPEIEQKVLSFWKKNKIFEKSLEIRKKSPRWTFLDGPPFVTGMPHYGSLLSSIPKDVFGRYFTMKGYYVRRVWGWDGHGLPIENKVENKLHLTRKKDIEEKVGVKKFIQLCKQYVNEVSGEWEWYVDHVGRWVDFKNAYKTWSKYYMESVMWVFHNMYEKGYIYKGVRVSLFCPHCVTPISNFEVAMDADNYKTITEDATIYKFKSTDEENTYYLAWSTTPWNKPVTTALAVNPRLTYVKVKDGKNYYILAKSALPILKKKNIRIIETMKGLSLVNRRYEPLYTFFSIDKGKDAFVIKPGDFVSHDEGTGIVTIAPYGEDDMKLMKKENIHIELHIDEEGIFKNYFKPFRGMYYLDANKKIDDDLKKRGLVYRIDPYTHNVPTCWRCHTRLYYAPQDAWFVNVQKLKPLMEKTNKKINWVPSHFKYGRFLKSMKAAPDWCISRSRYWGSPVPVWECSCGQRFVPSSIKELENRSGKKISDLHKPEIDTITVPCSQCGKPAHRVPEVLDSWIEAGSASFAERHFPFNKKEKLEDFFPPDFISEYTGQIRAWFYVLHVIGAALYESPAFRNVLVSGVILGDDGRKMSKNFKNYPDPKLMLKKYGGDALRLYLLGSPVMMGNDILISEEEYRNQVKDVLLIFFNSYKYFVLYANQGGWNKSKYKLSNTLIDQWILARLYETAKVITHSLDNYHTPHAVRVISDFVKDLSTWYIRCSRDRFIRHDTYALSTLYYCLITFSKLSAPVIPFITEEVYKTLTGKESVHLQKYPKLSDIKKTARFSDVLENMRIVREIVSKAHAIRKMKNISVRQPLSLLTVYGYNKLPEEYERLMLQELNIKKIKWIKKTNIKRVTISTKLTKKLIAEGKTRSIIHTVQNLRKKKKLSLDDKIILFLPDWPKEFEQMILDKTLALRIEKKDTVSIRKITGENKKQNS